MREPEPSLPEDVEINLARIFIGALIRLHPDDFVRRAERCLNTGEAQPVVRINDGEAVIWWGGEPLSFTPTEVLAKPNVDLAFTALPPVPDDARELTP